MVQKLKITRHELMVGTVCSLFGAGIVWVLGQLIRTAPLLGSTIVSSVKNFIYASAAIQSPNTILYFIVLISLGITVSLIFNIIHTLITIIAPKKTKTKSSKSHDTAKNEKSIDFELEIQRKEQSVLITGIKLIITSITLLIIIILYVFIVILIPSGLADSFDRDIKYIRPYVQEETVIKLQSDWVVMRSEDDYNAIYSEINKIKKEHLQKR